MALKDLTEFLTPPLELKWRERTFTVQPPSQRDGLVLEAINTVGTGVYMASQGACKTCGRSGDLDVDPTIKELAESIGNRSIGELSLGEAYQEMIDAGVPHPDMATFELYAMYYWTLGEAVADEIIKARSTNMSGTAAPKAQPPSRNGRSTASGSRSAKTKTATQSSRTTASRKK